MLSLQSNNNKIDLLNTHLVLIILITITLARIFALTLSPIELSVDEAQYWHWSLTPDFGYFTKPPMIAWVIGLSTSLFGNEEWAIRLCSPIFHFFISILLWITSQSIFGLRSGKIAALIWIFTPIAALGSFIISSDTPLLLFWSLALLFIFKLFKNEFFLYAVFTGLALGLAFLSKYAALYFLVLFIIWWIIYDRGNNINTKNLFLLVSTSFIISSSNIYWNYLNDFVTVSHTVSNADLKNIILNDNNVIEFLSSQLLVFGPIIFLLYIFIVFDSFVKNKILSLLALLSLPIIILITIQSFLKIANANWAVSAYIAATLILSAYVVVHNKRYLRFFFKIGMFLNICISLFILNVTITGSFKPFELKSNPLRKNLGFESHAKKIKEIVIANSISSVVFENRSDIARFNYYLNRFDNKLENNIYINSSATIPGNFYEANFDFRSQNLNVDKKVLIVTQSKQVIGYQKVSNINLIKKITEETIDGIKKEYYLFIGTTVK